jgi:hypothetical protein
VSLENSITMFIYSEFRLEVLAINKKLHNGFISALAHLQVTLGQLLSLFFPQSIPLFFLFCPGLQIISSYQIHDLLPGMRLLSLFRAVSGLGMGGWRSITTDHKRPQCLQDPPPLPYLQDAAIIRKFKVRRNKRMERSSYNFSHSLCHGKARPLSPCNSMDNYSLCNRGKTITVMAKTAKG